MNMAETDKIFTSWKIPARYEAVFVAAEDSGMNTSHLTQLAAVLGAAVDDNGEDEPAPVAVASVAPVAARPIPAPAPKRTAAQLWDTAIAACLAEKQS